MEIFTPRPRHLVLAVLLAFGHVGGAMAQYADTAYGTGALASITTGNYNTAMGFDTLSSTNIGSNNTASGYQAMLLNYSGTNNTAIGYYALYRTNGNNNIGIGNQAGVWLGMGDNNIYVGHPGFTHDNNVIRIGRQSVQKYAAIAGISGVNVTGGAAVVVSKTGQLGVELSSIRYKKDVHPMGAASERLLQLRPVTFHYKLPDEEGRSPEQYGLIAEEVAKVMPELVVYNEHGQAETVAYQSLTPMLLNELQREHSQVVMQAQIIARQNQRLDAMEAQLREVRRLTAQLTASH